MISPDAATAALARVDALHAALTGLVLEGGDLDRIAAEVARVLDVAVLITSTDGRERGSGGVTERIRGSLERADLVDPTGRFRVERTNADTAPVGDGEARMLRVAAGGEDLARLVGVRCDGPIDPGDVHALERAAAVAALVITREQAVGAVENKYQGDFLRDLFLRRAGDLDYVVEHAETYGWDLDRPVVVVCAELDPPRPDEGPISSEQRRAWQQRFAQGWRQVTRDLDPGIAGADFSEVVWLLPAADDEQAAAVVRRAVDGVAGDKVAADGPSASG
ncbi:MAG: hypothetical protein R2734_05650 [Nocardioides sp.]